MEDLGAGVQGALPGGVGVLDGHRQRAVGATQGLRRDGTHLGELVGDHQLRVAEAQLDLHVAPFGNADAPSDLGAEGLGVPVGGASSVTNDDVGCDRRQRPSLVVEDRQVDEAEPIRVVEEVELDDLAASHRDGCDREQLPVEVADKPGSAVDERRQIVVRVGCVFRVDQPRGRLFKLASSLVTKRTDFAGDLSCNSPVEAVAS
jgi:hypothetical protein